MTTDIEREMLRAAFPPRPIEASTAFEQRGRFYPDAEEYRRQMHGKTWEQLDPQFFARRSDGLSFLGTPHLAHVLPAYLHLLLALEPTSPVPETLLPMLTKPERLDEPTHLWDEVAMRFEELSEALTEAQRRVVAATLHAFAARGRGDVRAAQRALDRYWQRYLDEDPGRSR